MTLILNNDEVASLMDMDDYLSAMEEAFADLAAGEAVSRPRSHTYTPIDEHRHYLFKSMDGSLRRHGVHALRMSSDVIEEQVSDGRRRRVKIPAAPGGKWVGLVQLFSMHTGEPLAFIQDGFLQRMRVGATSGVVAKYLSRPDSRKAGIIGSGNQAGPQLMALCRVRDIESIKVYSSSEQNRVRFAREMSEELGIPVTPVDSARAAVEDVDILVTATNSLTAVLDGDWLRPGMHLNSLQSGELDDTTVQRADVIAVRAFDKPTHHAMTGLEVGEMKKGQRFRAEDEAKIRELGAIINGQVEGRTDRRQITLFGGSGTGGSSGLGIQFTAVARIIYEKAREAGMGREIPTDWLLQDLHP